MKRIYLWPAQFIPPSGQGMVLFLIIRPDQEKAQKPFALFAALRFNTKKQVNWTIEITSKELAEPFSPVLIVLQSSIINQQSKHPVSSILQPASGN